MQHKAGNLGVDLLLVDTGMIVSNHLHLLTKLTSSGEGDLHDGNGLSDAALPNGVLSNPIFDEIEYDILTIGTLRVDLRSILLIIPR